MKQNIPKSGKNCKEELNQNKMKQSAVEWLYSQMSNISAGYITELNEYEILQKAKEMEKEQIVSAHYQGYRNDIGTTEVSEQYYNETFKSE